MSQHAGLENVNALSTGGENLGMESDGLRTQMNQLIQDMSNDGDSLQGQALNDFRQAREQLTERFDELMNWCSQNGIKLNEGQQQFNITDTDSAADLSQAGNDLGGLSRPVNA
ncbi:MULTISPECIES: hypothetical protein [Nocardiopsis]|uniref:Uncharacterized protein n=1 Tax=Nocardiopsis sinuspersici TaxID=501010 RepID=A0A1V3C580_9ACTN|nr:MULTISPECIES: hypothetical protein [Nocardiopsis]NYH52443.1 hypothetical protein [Nocardiopsis sinuspersici]OOC55927.1 hypothetical protein NOSIN_20550 [Nocardiopsis sinuspersici]